MVQQTRIIIDELEAFEEELIRRISVNATAGLIEDTPVDTGWARANWVAQIGGPFEGTVGTRDAAVAGNVNTSVQITALAGLAASYSLDAGAVFITNNVPYIVRLNEGSSAQAPAAFVQARIIRTLAEEAGASN